MTGQLRIERLLFEIALLTEKFVEMFSMIFMLNKSYIRGEPFASGEIIKRLTEDPPALQPAIVMLLGSPPNALMFSFTHFKAAI